MGRVPAMQFLPLLSRKSRGESRLLGNAVPYIFYKLNPFRDRQFFNIFDNSTHNGTMKLPSGSGRLPEIVKDKLLLLAFLFVHCTR
jgi:hypothetical protein